jgi:PKD repeat protein
LLPAAAGAVATDLLADWQMNESAGAATMVDGSGNGINGAIGDAVVTGYEVMGATAYHWTNTQPNLPPAKPERLVQVNDARLNPQSDDYAITVRFRTTRPFGNIIQKGQSGNLGGNWKWQIPNGQLGCTFRGYDENGTELQKTVNSGSPDIPQFDPLNDGEWHTVRCERRGDQLIMTVNVGTPDEYVRRANGPTGHISNNVPLTIGGKVNCTGLPGITCDYFVGDIDFVQIHTGPREPVDTPPTASASADCDYLECSFSSAGSVDPDGGALDYSWDFGDGRMSTQPNPVHTYDAPGDYRVELTVTDDENDDDADVVNLDVQTAPPVAAFDVTCDFLECTFDASDSIDPDGTIVDYEWDFGDDAGGSGESAVHTYSDTGSYDVALTVTDNHGATDMITGAVAAEAAPPVHVHWLIASPWDRDGDKWVARVIVRMRDGDENPHAGVGVTVRFGANKERSCVTGANGNCVVKVKVNDSRAKIPAEVIAVDWAGGYDPSMNHDIDGDGDGETVVVLRPF